jgi:predicted AAA+ superfamily ATPase
VILRPWREIAEPHSDVREGKFQQAEFAADLSRVNAGTANPEYQNPVLFFQRTFITEGMRLLFNSVIKRLAGKGGDPVIQLQTAFGGGKTHTMLAVYHIAKGMAVASDLQGVPTILDEAGVTELPKARIAVLDGNKSSPNQPMVIQGQSIRTLWGDLAWQLGGSDGYALVAAADASGTSPGKEVLASLLERYAPCIILIDELVAYVRQFNEGKVLTGGTFDSNLSFIQALTEALKAVPTAVLLASLPQSAIEAGSEHGKMALDALSHYFGRVQSLWKPVATEEAFEIVRRRLFNEINNKSAMADVCRLFAEYYIQNRDDFPQETQEGKYLRRLEQAYPIHPEVFDRLYEDWSSLDNFQRTRGVLKMMATVIHRLWKDGNNDPLIMPGNFPLMDAETRNEMIYYLPQGWDPVIERDVDGERSETWEIENENTRLGSVQACRRAARTIFLGSAPSTSNKVVRGIERQRVMLGVALPGQQVNIFKDALRRLGDKLHYLNVVNDRFWLDIRPNLRREMEERKRRFMDNDDIFPAIRNRIGSSLSLSTFGGIHIFTGSGDVPDDWTLRLVVLSPDAGYLKSGPSVAIEWATEILKKRGDHPRFKQNRLIFLSADYETVDRLKDYVRSHLAWESIIDDYKNNHIVLDNLMASDAQARLELADKTVQRTLREVYKWLLTPVQQAQPGKGVSEVIWEHFLLDTNSPNWSQTIERVLKENELVIDKWAPIHLIKELKNWFWVNGKTDVIAQTVWYQFCQQLYLPRLQTESVFQAAMDAGAQSDEFFGFAQGKEEQDGKCHYIGFSFGKPNLLVMDSSLLLIEPLTAAAYLENQRIAQMQSDPGYHDSETIDQDGVAGGGKHDWRPGKKSDNLPAIGKPARLNTQFYANADLDPIRAKMQFTNLVDEVLQLFTTKPGIKVKISVEIQAQSPSGFDTGLERSVKENCNTLNFKNAHFESDE